METHISTKKIVSYDWGMILKFVKSYVSVAFDVSESTNIEKLRFF